MSDNKAALHLINAMLVSTGAITEKEYNSMREKIDNLQK